MQKITTVLFFFVAFFCLPPLIASDRQVTSNTNNVTKALGLAAFLYGGYQAGRFVWNKLSGTPDIQKKGKSQSKIAVNPQQKSDQTNKRNSNDTAFAFRDLSPKKVLSAKDVKEKEIIRQEKRLKELEEKLAGATKLCKDLPIQIEQAKDKLQKSKNELKEIIEKIKKQDDEAKKEDEALTNESCLPCARKKSSVSPSSSISVPSDMPSFCLTPRTSLATPTVSPMSSTTSLAYTPSHNVQQSPSVSPLASSHSAPFTASALSASSASSLYSFKAKTE